jgi:mono/diheme cytochrome c family protein
MRKAIKWAGIVLASLIVLLLVLGAMAFMIGSSKVNSTHDVETADLTIPTDSAATARGGHLADIFGCTICHGNDLGGSVIVDAPPFRITAANLTAGEGGIGLAYTAEDFDRAIRHGVKPDGRAVMIMPSSAFHDLSEEDIATLITYLQSVPPVDNVLPPTEIRAIGRIMSALVIDPAIEVRSEPARSEPAPPVGATAEYGEYLASITCAHCHGDDHRGMTQPPDPDSPPSPDLAAAGRWSLDQFKHALRTGERPSSEPMDERYMPYGITAQMDDVELEALYAYLATLLE